MKGVRKTTALKKARRACDAAVTQGSIFRGGLPHALRIRGAVEWLSSNEAGARASWDRRLSVAQELGARYDVAMTRMECGRRLSDRDDLQRGGEIVAEVEDSFKHDTACPAVCADGGEPCTTLRAELGVRNGHPAGTGNISWRHALTIRAGTGRRGAARLGFMAGAGQGMIRKPPRVRRGAAQGFSQSSSFPRGLWIERLNEHRVDLRPHAVGCRTL